MFRSLRTRLLLTYLFVTILVLALVGMSLLLFLLNNPIITQLVYSRLDSVAANVQQISDQGLNSSEIDRVQNVVERMGRRFNVRILMIERSGTLLADSQPEAGLSPDDDLSSFLLEEGTLQGIFTDQLNKDWLWAGIRLERGRTLVVASQRPRLFSLMEFADDVLRPVLQAGAIGLIVSFLLAWLISRWVASRKPPRLWQREIIGKAFNWMDRKRCRIWQIRSMP
jgi:hypothetical protein